MEHRFLIVWGMHRSGTSLLSRAMQVFGAAHADSQLVIHSGNPTGYWEDRALVSLDAAMLDFLGVGWDSLDVLTSEQIDGLEQAGFLAKARDFLLSAKLPFVALKDPRMAKLGGFWNRAFAAIGISPLCVVAYRNPLSVVHSLQRRKGIPQSEQIAKRSYCYELWWHYTTQALMATAAYPRVCVEYDLFLQYPEDMLRRMGQQLDLPVDQDAMKIFLNSFLNAGHRHNLHGLGEVLTDPECPKRVAQTYCALYERAGSLQAISDFV